MLPTELREKLSTRLILTPEQILAIKQSLLEETIAPANQAKQLAKRLHALIDHQLPNLEQNLRQQLRMDLLQRAVKQSNYYLNALDVLDTCATNYTSCDLLPSLKDWLNDQHNLTISNEALAGYFNYPAAPRTITVLAQPSSINFGVKLLPLTVLVVMITLAVSLRLLPLLEAHSEPQPISLVSSAVKENSNSLPSYLLYRDIDEHKLVAYLNTRNSLIAEPKYREAVNSAAKNFNINPLLLYAIMGQEQGFVPKTNPQAHKIANNPFNVFHSWQEYNTTIEDSATIASRTVINLSANRPHDADPFQWLNRRYAEDKLWWKGVKTLYLDLEKKVGYREEQQ